MPSQKTRLPLQDRTAACARHQKGDAVTCVLKYRAADSRQRRHLICRHGAPWTEAHRILGEFVPGGDRAGERQAKLKAETMKELCRNYLADARAGRIVTRLGRRWRGKAGFLVLVVLSAACVLETNAWAESPLIAPLSGPDSHETPPEARDYLFGDWAGARQRLFQRGVSFDFQYISDTLWGLKSQKNSQFAMWNRVRGTVDVDFGALSNIDGLYFHATALWQAGGNLGEKLGLLIGPSGMASANTTRLDSWWIEKRWLDERVIARIGQFAGQDFYGNQHFASSFIFEPMGYAMGNLSTTVETFNPFSTPAAEIRIAPFDQIYVKSMVMAGNPEPFAHNPTGLVPEFRGHPVVVSEIAFTPGQNATSVRSFDNVDTRKGYSGLYQFGAAINPGNFMSPTSPTPIGGNYLLYWKASQAIWRVNPKEAQGLDATVAFDWSPPDVNRNYTQFTAGLRYNEPLPLGFHNSMSLGYVQTSLSPNFLTLGQRPWKAEHGLELNVLMLYGPLLVQPVAQYYINAGGVGGKAFVGGFRVKLEL